MRNYGERRLERKSLRNKTPSHPALEMGTFSHEVAIETKVTSPRYWRIKLVRVAALMLWGEVVFRPCLISLRIVRRFARIVFIHAKGPSAKARDENIDAIVQRLKAASSSACLLLKTSASSSNEWTPSTSSSTSSNEASMHWSISTHMGIREPAHQVFVPTNLVACRSVFESTGPEGQFQQAGGLYRDISQA